MRINKFIAASSSLSRRSADTAIKEGRVTVNGQPPVSGYDVTDSDIVMLDGAVISAKTQTVTIMLNKPPGYVCSRNGQGNLTIFDLLPLEYQSLNPVGRLDKNSSGLLLLTDDGSLANELTHPRYGKQKVYEVELNQPLQPLHQQMISDYGVQLEDGPSKLSLEKIDDSSLRWKITMSEGRNRQIRRTFKSLGYSIKTLHRTDFGHYTLGKLAIGNCLLI